jgi:hypothetical protein
MHCVERLDRPDAVPLGLAAGVIYHPSAIGRLEKATGKLEERFLREATARKRNSCSDGARRRRRSCGHCGIPNRKTYRQTIQRADEILREVQADTLAHLSDTSPLGFDQRLARVGERFLDVVQRGAWDLWMSWSTPIKRYVVTIWPPVRYGDWNGSTWPCGSYAG